MKSFRVIVPVIAVLVATLATPVLAQEQQTDLLLFTEFPSQVVGLGESVKLELDLRTDTAPQFVDLEVRDLPDGWSATFRNGNRIINSVYVTPENNVQMDLRVEAPEDAAGEVFQFTAVASSDVATSELPLEFSVEEKVPASLALEVDLPTLRGRPDSTFRYSATLRNEGDEDLIVDLLGQTPASFGIIFKSGTQEVTSLPLEADSAENINIEVLPLRSLIPANNYPITVTAQGGDASTSIDLMAEVVGQSTINMTTPDGRLSGRAEAGEETPISLLIENTGSAPALSVEMNASEPSGWAVEFEPATIDSIAPGEFVEVTAKITPAEKALAGDYVVTFRAAPEEGTDVSAEYRVTVRTSTIWGVVGIGLIAAAVVVVGLAVMRFGRR